MAGLEGRCSEAPAAGGLRNEFYHAVKQSLSKERHTTGEHCFMRMESEQQLTVKMATSGTEPHELNSRGPWNPSRRSMIAPCSTAERSQPQNHRLH